MSELNVSTDGGVARVQLNRPDVLNALSPSLLESIIGACNALNDCDDTNVVVLEGAGRSFSSGADLPAFSQGLEAKSRDAADLGRRAADALASLPQITTAAIHGHCVGGGIVLAAACDLRIATDTSRFSVPEVDAGIPLAWGGMGRLVRLVGETRAVELVLSCRPFDAEEALQAGFLTRVVAEAEFAGEVSAFAESVAGKPGAVLRLVKRQLAALRDGTFDPRNDADALLAAFHDPEARSVGNRYVASRIKKTR